jgi:hypothetical protein
MGLFEQKSKRSGTLLTTTKRDKKTKAVKSVKTVYKPLKKAGRGR